MRSEENSLGWYVKNSLDVLLQGVRASSVIRSEEIVSKDEFKTAWNNDKLDRSLSWKFIMEGKKAIWSICKRNARNDACRRIVELVAKSVLEDANRSTCLCRPRTSPWD